MRFIRGQHIHFVGIGGAGLSSIARVLLERGGYTISGSDRVGNSLTEALARDGAIIYQGHDAANIKGASMLIISSAVRDNPEVNAAKAARIPVYKRKDILASLMAGKTVIAVAGTHGKTTTTAMIVHMLRELGADPSYIVGGVMRNTGTNAGVGKGDIFVIEADEYDDMYHGLRPNVIILTNVEYDHPDYFRSEDELMFSFRRFVDLMPKNNGNLFYCAENVNAHVVAESVRYKYLVDAYGFTENGVLFADNIRNEPDGTRFALVSTIGDRMKGWPNAETHLALAGQHNVLNALGATCAMLAVRGVADLKKYAAALETFKGTERRFELRGEKNAVAVIDDYAHHPTAIRATLEAARSRYPEREIWAVWQPHTYSRTRALADDYAAAFGSANHVLVTDVYAARENAPDDSDAARFAAQMTARIQHADARHTGTLDATTAVLRSDVKAPAVILIMSAGDAPQIGKDYLTEQVWNV